MTTNTKPDWQTGADEGHEAHIAELRRFAPAAIGGDAEPVIGVAATMLSRKDARIVALEGALRELVAARDAETEYGPSGRTSLAFVSARSLLARLGGGK